MTSFEVLNCSSESDEFPALHLQTGQGAWQTDGYVREATIDLGFNMPTSFDKVELGNLGCAFIELLVAKEADSDEYEALVAPVALQSYSESKSNTNRTKSFVFTMKDKLKAKVAQQSWSKLRIICKQTFNTTMPIGLGFVRINSTSKTLPAVNTNTKPSGASNTNTSTNNNAALNSTNKTASKSRLVFEEEEEQEESAADLFHKLKPQSLTFAQLKAQVELDQRANVGKKSETKSATKPVEKSAINSAAQVRDNPFSETKSATKPAEKSATHSNTILGNKSADKKSDTNTGAKNSIKDTKNSHETKNSTIKDTKNSNTKVASDNKNTLPNKAKPNTKTDDSKKSVPLNKVMAGVTIVISGIQNPERHKLRTLVKEMGGRYNPDWDEGATHLIAVFPNAPKVQQAAQDGATIVTKDWIYDSHKRAARQKEQQYLLGGNNKQHKTKDSEEESDEGPNEYDYDDGFLVADDAMDGDYDPSSKPKPKSKPKNKAVMLADDDLDTINEAEQWLSSTKSQPKSQPKQGVKRKQEDEDEEEELLRLNKKVKLDKSAAKSTANQLQHESDSGEGTEGMAEDDIEAQVQQMKSGKLGADNSNNKNHKNKDKDSTHKSTGTKDSPANKSTHPKHTSHKPNSVVQDDDELTDEMREEEIRSHLQRASSQLSRDSQGTQELGEDELLY